MPDVNGIQAAQAEAIGLDRKTKKPFRSTPFTLPADINKQLRILDESNAVNRYV